MTAYRCIGYHCGIFFWQAHPSIFCSTPTILLVESQGFDALLEEAGYLGRRVQSFGSLYLQALVEEGDESVGVGTDQLVGLLAVLEQHEGGHGADAKLLAQLGEVIDVDLGEEDILVLLVVGVAR